VSTSSLADLRANKPTGTDQRLVVLSLRPDLFARVTSLTSELAALPEPEEPAPQRKMAQAEAPKPPENPRAAEIRADLQSVLDEIARHEGELTVRKNRTDGEWRRWANEHPPRGKGEPGYERDHRYGDLVNIDDLIADLAAYAHAWNGEELAEGDWATIFEPSTTGGQKYEVAEAVLAMYEGRADFRQWRSALSTTLQRWSDSVSPEASESATSDSTAGSPEPSSEATTGTGDRLL
jgi:hypothetical protein